MRYKSQGDITINFEACLNDELTRSPRSREADEARHPWLTILLDAYHILTIGTILALTSEVARREASPACKAGCTACCLRPEVPVSELELLGIWWYVVEKLPPEERIVLNERLIRHREILACPFLVEMRCAIYPLRPLACRFLHVFGAPCKAEEITIETRQQDIWLPREAVPRTVLTMLTYFGFATDETRRQALAEGYLVSVSTPMGNFPWESLATARKK
ncbi:MAG: YkgJ family cysteine cluster protein [Dehalococcoidia bacterium]|nr:YkgJ family cysteine cluster protein [Dehalococcoidia bacterium]